MTINTDKIFIIHYTQLSQRKEFMDAQIASLDNKCVYIDKFDKEDMTPDVANRLHRQDESEYNKKVAPLWDVNVHSYRDLTDAEISCASKHFEAVRRIGEECEVHGLILEDDAVFNSNFTNGFNHCLPKTPEDWDVILLGTGCGEWFIKHQLQGRTAAYSDSKSSIFKMPHPATNCAEGYLVKKEAAKKIYDSIIPFDLAGDWELAYQFYKLDLNVYWWVPPLLHQGSKTGQYKSALDEGRVIR
jgi:glycosyl transferase family 25